MVFASHGGMVPEVGSHAEGGGWNAWGGFGTAAVDRDSELPQRRGESPDGVAEPGGGIAKPGRVPMYNNSCGAGRVRHWSRLGEEVTGK